MIWCLPGIFHSDGFLYNSHCPYFILHTASPLVPRPGATKIPENQFDVSTIAAYPYQGQGTPRPPGPLANGAQWPAHLSTANNRSPAGASQHQPLLISTYPAQISTHIYTYLLQHCVKFPTFPPRRSRAVRRQSSVFTDSVQNDDRIGMENTEILGNIQ